MRLCKAAIMAAGLAMLLSPAISNAGEYGHIIVKYPVTKPPVVYHPPVHHVKPPVVKPASSKPSSSSKTTPGSGSGGSWTGITHALYVTGASCLAAHIGQFVFVGITEKRARTDKEVDMIFVGCTWGLYGIEYYRKWGDGKRKPKPMLDVIDKRHDPIS